VGRRQKAIGKIIQATGGNLAAVNGAVLAVMVFSQLQVVLSCILLAATIFRDVHQDCQGAAGV